MFIYFSTCTFLFPKRQKSYTITSMKRFFSILLILFCSLGSYCFANNYDDIYNSAWQITADNFYDSAMNNQNWGEWKNRYKGKLRSEEDLNTAISTMLDSLDDQYTRYLLKTDFKNENSDIHDDYTSLSKIPRYYKTHIPKDIKYMRIDSMMNKNLTSEIRDFILESEKDKNVKGYIIDLRDNGGGLVKNASDIASLFMSDKIVLFAKTNKKMVQNKTASNEVITTKPVVILINGYTASACEVFTGAMQDNKRAYVIGTTSYGKGIIQQIKKLPDESGLHITVMSYYTPEFKEINKKGVTPDKEVYFTRKDIFFHRDVQLLKGIKYLKDK